MSMFDTRKEEVNVQKEEPKKEAAPAEEVVERASYVNPAPSDEVAVISSSTKIEGNVTTEGSLVLQGIVQGSIVAKGSVALNGNASGSISCASILVDTENSATDINATENVIVGEGNTVTGDIRCKSITVLGTVIGNIYATDSVFLKKGATVTGNISADNFAMEFGAHIRGKVESK